MEALIVEDEIDICYLLSGILRKRNITSNYVTTITEAERTLITKNPAVLFLDNHLPDGHGLDLLDHVKKNHPTTKIVMITAHDTPLDKEKALSKGVDVFIGKPFTRDTIYHTLEILFNKSA